MKTNEFEITKINGVETISKKDYLKTAKPNIENYNELIKNFSWEHAKKDLTWFDSEHINIAYNICEANLEKGLNKKTAIFWENEKGNKKEISFEELNQMANRSANVLKNHGIKKGDRVFLFLPRIPELYYSFLGILKTGGIASTIFQAFFEQGLYDRLDDSSARFLITHESLVGRLKNIRKKLPHLEKIFVVGKTDKDYLDYNAEIQKASSDFECEKTHQNDPAFMLYTSGTTGKPVGVVHSHKSLIQQKITGKWILDFQEKDIFWCTADPGWVTGIVYGLISPLACGIPILIYDGRFDAKKWYQLLQDYKISIFYTAPTAIRMLMEEGEVMPAKYNFSNLRHMASVGEALNPECVKWGLKVFHLPFHDTWWQTECGAMMICNFPSLDIKLGSMGKPIPGIAAQILDDLGKEVSPNSEGNLVIENGWPSQMAAAWGYKSLEISDKELDIGNFKGDLYFTGDRAKKDKDGYFWFIGRADDVIKTSGERVGPFEVESALLTHPAVLESGVIGKPDKLRGQIIKAFIVLKNKYQPSEKLKTELSIWVKTRLAGHAYPREIDFVEKLPKNSSGKIIRRVLKSKELNS